MDQVTAVQEQNARNMKDFLELYNKLTEQCFQKCVSTFFNKSLSADEAKCTDICSERYIKFNQRMMLTYMDYQNAKQEDAIKEMERAKAEGRTPNLPGFSVQSQQGLGVNPPAEIVTSSPVEVPTSPS